MQTNLFCELRQPFVWAYGAGVDSTAGIVACVQRQIRINLILHADVGAEKDETVAYIQVFNQYLRHHHYPEVTVVRYVPQDFKNWPPYYTLEENCLTNGTLPSISFSFRFKSCSQKWKAAPQHKFLQSWAPAREWWSAGGKVKKAIGYDASPADERRRTYACNSEVEDDKYEYWYPLQEWGWDRERCKREIAAAGLPVPLKSSCIFCAAMQPWEVAELPPKELRRIVRLEARARPRFKTEAMKGLWGRDNKKRPGSMTRFILEHGLLPATEVARIIAETPTELVAYQEAYRNGQQVPPFGAWLADQLVQIGEPA